MKIDEAFANLKRCIESGQMAHGYIIVGPPRGEAQALAEKFLSLVFCTAGSGRPCGECGGCQQVVKHTHPDIIWVEPQKKSRQISIDQIRDLQRPISQTPLVGEHKACVIVAADRLGEGASNAFLKTLEEPPGKSVFLLLTDSPQFLMSTILSRCQRIVVSTDLAGLRAAWVEPVSDMLCAWQPGSAVGMFAMADGMGRILKEMKATAEQEEKAATEVETVDSDDETFDGRVNARYREMRSGLMLFMLRWYRDILVVSCGSSDDLVCNRNRLDFLRQKGRELNSRQALRNVEVVETMIRQMERNLPDQFVMSHGFGQLK